MSKENSQISFETPLQAILHKLFFLSNVSIMKDFLSSDKTLESSVLLFFNSVIENMKEENRSSRIGYSHSHSLNFSLTNT